MTAIWFGLAAIALVGAIVLLYFDRQQRQRTGHIRQVWAKSQGYTYVSVEPALANTWRRGALAKLGYLSAVDVVSGNRKGEKFVLFDLEDAATLVAVRRQIGSDIDIDLRLKTAAPPKDHDLELLGAIGGRVVFATNPDIARHAVDQRMVAFIESLPDTVHMLWSEGNWTLGMLHVNSTSRDWEMAIDAVLRLSGLLHVLPPVVGGPEVRGGGRGPAPEQHDGARPQRGSTIVVDDEDDEDDDYDGHDQYGDYGDQEPARVAEPPRQLPPRAGDPLPFPEDDAADDYAPLVKDIAGESEPDAEAEGWRPALKVVPDPRGRVRRNWPPAPEDEWAEEDEDTERPEPAEDSDEEWDEDWRDGDDDERDGREEHGEFRDDERDDPPGGPFHPGFRPYQGPAPR
ncbi:hypothetical protein HLB23_37510 [Nocardia uniformis]|uniref:Uncharacterized protein n=1 Tax=Nocardia uniformis TaxID=53432 RepID=A0A849C9J4_9NOCA|nr:hypothetical protein [Nocardia uniformis]NNH75483.1 hypothetical protein [Nocardia uniformis]